MFAKISRVFLYASLVAPLVVIRSSFFPFIAGKTITFRVLVELALLFFLCHLLVERKAFTTRLKQPMVIAVMVFGFVYLLSAFFGVNAHNSLWSNFERGDGAIQVLHYVIFFVLLVLLFPDKKSMRWPLLAHVGVSLATSAYALGQLINSADPSGSFFLAANTRVSGTLGNPSYLAAYLLLNLGVLAYLFLQRKEVWWRSIFAAIFVFETYILLSTGTRAALIGLIVGFVIVCIINLIITKSQALRLWLVGGLMAVVALIGIFFATHTAVVWQHLPVVSRLINFESAVTDIQPRIWTWGTALESAKDRPILGYGSENFPYPFDKYYNPNHFGIESFFDRTHNIFLEYLVTGGVLLLLAWLAIFYFYYRRLMKQPKDFWWSVMFAMPIMYFCQGFFLFDTLPIYVILFLFLAFFAAEDSEKTSYAEDKVGTPALIVIIVLIAATACSFYYADYLPARKNYLLTKALQLQNAFTNQVSQGQEVTVTPAMVITGYETTIAYGSPVGQEEAIGNYQRFISSIVEMLAKNQQVIENPEFVKQIRVIVDRLNFWFDNNQNLFIGVKDLYINGAINLRAGFSFNQPELVARGKRLYRDALTANPNRIEIINVLLEVARIEKNQAAYDEMLGRAKSLRPDIKWD